MRPIIQKVDYVHDRDWLDWVKERPSCISGMPADDPHHIKGYSRITGSGGGIKGHDLFVIPLTRMEHSHFDYLGWQTWEREHDSQLVHWAKLMLQALRDGVITINL